MPLPQAFAGRLRLPAVAAPMFLVSGPDLVVETCRAGVIGTFPALNQRTSDGLAAWIEEIEARLAAAGDTAAPYGINLIVHRSNPRLQADLEIVVARRVPECAAEYGRRGWSMFPSIDRVYVNARARTELGWRPRHDFAAVIARLASGGTVASPLAREIGAKGYHAGTFAEGPYPVE